MHSLSSSTARATFVAAIASATVALVGPTVALGGAPTIDRIEIGETFDDTFLGGACGFPVQTHVEGRLTTRTFERDHGTVDVMTINVAVVSSAGDATYRFRDVGADTARIAPDGSLVLQTIGQIPFDFNGVSKEDGTGIVIHAPRALTGDEVQDACDALRG